MTEPDERKLAPVDASRDNFLFAGRPPNADEWNEFLVRFHHQYPRATSDVFCQLTDEHGRTSYELIAQRAAEELAPDARVLELGCGEGELLSQIAKLRPDAVLCGVDLVEKAVACARSVVPNAEVIVGDASAAPWAAETFDLAVSHMVLPYAHDGVALLREAHRLLRPGGRFAFALPDARVLSTFATVLAAGVTHVRNVHDGYGIALQTDERLLDARRTPELFASCGLRIESDDPLVVGAGCDRGLLVDYVRRTYPLGLLDDVMLADVVDSITAQAPERLEITLRLLRGSRAKQK